MNSTLLFLAAHRRGHRDHQISSQLLDQCFVSTGVHGSEPTLRDVVSSILGCPPRRVGVSASGIARAIRDSKKCHFARHKAHQVEDGHIPELNRAFVCG